MQPHPPLTCVLFDLDGTLVDTTDLIFESYRHTLESVLGYSPSDEELLGQYGRPLPDTMRELLVALARRGGVKGAPIEAAAETDRPVQSISAQTGVLTPDEAVVDRLVSVYRDFNLQHHDAFIRSFPYAVETLAELRRRGYALGLVTSKGRLTTERSLQHYSLQRFLDTIITADDTVRHKPDPEPVLRALANLGRQPSEALFVGDSVHDVAAGQAAGTLTAAALWGPFPREELEALRPDYLLASLPDLLAICPPRG